MRYLVALFALLPATALAQAADAAPSAPSPIAGLMPLAFIFVIMYFLIIRPQQKQAKQHQEMVKAVKKGDTVLTSGGIIGRVTKTEDTTVMVEIAPSVEVKVSRSMLNGVLDKDGKPVTPAKNDGKNDNVKAPTKSVANDN